MYRYVPEGVCSKMIEIETEGDVVTEVRFTRGCRGNTAGISQLVRGMKVDEIISRLSGIPCQGETSCPDQLACALRQMKEDMKAE